MASVNASSLDPPLGGPSGQDVNNPNDRTMPIWMDRSNRYGQRIVLSLQAAGKEKLPKPFIVGKSIDQAGGELPEPATTEEKHTKYVIKTRNAAQAKKLMEMRQLIDGTKVEVSLHSKLNFSQCVVSCPEVIDLPEEELKADLADQGVTNVRRITRVEGKDKVNTATLVLTVNGTVFPKHIMFGPLRAPTRLFYPSPMMCFNCYSYGHTKAKCQSPPICRVCSNSHPLDDGGCKRNAFCKNCKGNHPPTNRKCPEFIKEEKIIKIKVETGVNFAEARKEYFRLHGNSSYAAVSSAQERLEHIRQENEKDNEIRLLKEEIAKMKESTANDKKDEEIAKLREEIADLKNLVSQLSQSKVILQNPSGEQQVFAISGSDEDMEVEKQSGRSSNGSEKKSSSASKTAAQSKERVSTPNTTTTTKTAAQKKGKSKTKKNENEGYDSDRSRSSRSDIEDSNKDITKDVSARRRGRPRNASR